jgi:hypothetical protein
MPLSQLSGISCFHTEGDDMVSLISCFHTEGDDMVSLFLYAVMLL